MDRQNRQERQNNERHQRFSWQTPLETPPEQDAQTSQQVNQHTYQSQSTARLNTNVDTQRSRVFSYAQTPAEHLAFQYIPSPSDVPPLPQSPPTPIDPRPQSVYTLHNPQTQPRPQLPYPSPAYQEKPLLSPLSPHEHTNALPSSPVSPVVEPPRIYAQAPAQHTQHARNLSNLSPLNTNVGQYSMLPIPPTPASHNTQTDYAPHRTPVTPITPSSIKKDPTDLQPPTSPKSYAHEAYSPHNLSATNNTRHAVFSPDSAHGPNGLDFALHQPGQVAHPNMDLSAEGTTRGWKHSLCSCTGDISTCLTGFFCPCILYGRTSYRMSQKSAKRDPTDMLSYKSTNGHCIMMAVSCGLWWLYPMIQRTRLRHTYKLEGSLVGDCIRSACCCCCVAVQNEREIKGREEARRMWAGPANTQVYQSPGQMRYARQN